MAGELTYAGGGWEVDIRFPRPDGTLFRERRKAPTSSKTGALRWGQDRERHLLAHGRSTPKKEVPTLNEFAPRFLQEYAVANRQKPSSVESAKKILRVHLLPALGRTKLNAIDSSQVQQLKFQLRDKAPKTVNNILCTLNVMLKTAVEWKVLDQVSWEIALLPVARKEASFHDFDAYERLVESARACDWRALLTVLLGGQAGLRCSEIVALQWADVDFGRNRLTVRHSDWRGALTSPKNGRTRTVPLTERLAEALRQHRHRRSPRVLCTDTGQPVTRRVAWGWVSRACKRAKVPSGVHILRHTFCSHLAMKGASGKAIQELAGHQELTMTQRYMHLSPAALESAIGLLDARSRPAEHGEMMETAECRIVS